MTKITTEDCKKFIVQFQKDNPELERIRFGIEPTETVANNPDLQFLSDCLIESNWKRTFKRKPDKYDGTSVYISGQELDLRYPEPKGKVLFDDIKWARGFDMITADGQIAYLVFEMNDGTLHIGDYIGD